LDGRRLGEKKISLQMVQMSRRDEEEESLWKVRAINS